MMLPINAYLLFWLEFGSLLLLEYRVRDLVVMFWFLFKLILI